MKQIYFSIFILLNLLLPAIIVSAQSSSGLKLSLNEDGTFNCTGAIVADKERQPAIVYDVLPGFPKRMLANPSFKNTRGATLADINNDGIQEILVGAWDTLFVYNGNGNLLWKKKLSGTTILPPTVADVNNDNIPEIVVTTGGIPAAGRVYLLDELGNDLPGWPLNFNNHWMINAPVIADINGDKKVEILFDERVNSTQGFIHAVKVNGEPFNENWPVELPGTPAFTPSVGDIDRDGIPDIVISISSGELYVLDTNGLVLNGFPMVQNGSKFSYQSPLLADITHDGFLEIVGSRHGDAPDYYVARHDGTYAPGWPYALPGWTYSPPTVVDSDLDGAYELYFGHPQTSDTEPLDVIFGFHEDGSMLPGFPIKKYGGNEGVITVADVNADFVPDIIFTSNTTDSEGYGYVHAYSLDGSGELPGFPLRPRGFTFLGAAHVGDVNNDGYMDLTVPTYTATFGAGIDSAYLYVYDLQYYYNEGEIHYNTYKGSNARDGNRALLNTGIAYRSAGKGLLGLYPNPAREEVRFMPEINISSAQLRIYDLSGRLLFEQSLSMTTGQEQRIDVSFLRSGMYMVMLSDGQQLTTGKLLIK
ncbi:MAG: VCBS repeat-containing protein [Lentimicrobium sp.]|nr:VCBS repeat-containing protein [Lentimicrobium sp.]MDD2527565.1 T9SS type A sorting domain-containing protein [Lentimicrobiaceae bacterium]MDD4597123.1 T9SS type A sorting domain-containing protein [Lentimicrobiaceae bacterium]MDY0025124.1 T9SS type A sorting domain-containing protein [Lentimicrobium sp.]